MRLSKKEIEALKYALDGIIDETYLFGSRTNDKKKGGDIDILIYSKTQPYQLSKKIAVRFFSKCESKIDIIVADPDNMKNELKAFIREQTLVPIR